MLVWAQHHKLNKPATDHLVMVLMHVDNETLRREAAKHNAPKHPTNG